MLHWEKIDPNRENLEICKSYIHDHYIYSHHSSKQEKHIPTKISYVVHKSKCDMYKNENIKGDSTLFLDKLYKICILIIFQNMVILYKNVHSSMNLTIKLAIKENNLWQSLKLSPKKTLGMVYIYISKKFTDLYTVVLLMLW